MVTSNPVVTVDEIRSDLFAALPHLRAFAISLTSDADRGDDLVQETLVRALAHLDQFERGTNLQGWLFTILRNQFHTFYRKRRREVEDPEGLYAAQLAVPPEQGGYLDFCDFGRALEKLAPEQREAILLVGAEGLTYDETAVICGCAVGTIKSRVNRARKRLTELLALGEMEEIGPDRLVQASFRDMVLQDRRAVEATQATP